MFSNNNKNQAFKDALLFDIYRHMDNGGQFHEIIDYLLNREIIIKHRNKKRYRDALKQIILNLFIGFACNKPIRFSRRKAEYCSNRRYGKLWFKYDIMIMLIDRLEELGYLKQKKGYFNRRRNKGKLSRMWLTEKMLKLFNKVKFSDKIEREAPAELIHLKNKKKELIKYKETQNTIRMWRRLKRYNNFIIKQDITLRLNSITTSFDFLKDLNLWFLKKDILLFPKFTNSIYIDTSYTDNNRYKLKTIGHFKYISYKQLHKRLNKLNTKNRDYKVNIDIKITKQNLNNLNKYIQTNLPLLVQFSYLDHYLWAFNLLKNTLFRGRRSKRDDWINLVIGQLYIKLHYLYLHRVFNNGSFRFGGRFYGSIHMQLPREYRKGIFINGNPTVELDYSALHIRMLYHLKGIDYQDDPYSCSKNKNDRDKLKKVLLVLINADERKRAIDAIRKAFMEMGYRDGLKDRDINTLIEDFIEFHGDIKEFMHTGIGLKLQKIDSMIMEDILINLMRKDIPALPIHDSVIVEKRFEDELRQEMISCYKKHMNGFEPIIH